MSAASARSNLRLLFITQELDAQSSNLGVAHVWAGCLARQIATLHVIAARTGAVDLPTNVHLHALGKDRGAGRLQRWARLLDRCRALVYGGQVDGVLAHMVPAYALAAAPWTRLRRVPLVLWYTSHGDTGALRWANRLINAAATASPESYPPGGGKAFVLGHGIDTARFHPPPGRRAHEGAPVLGAAGRITPLKGFEVVIRALAELRTTSEMRPRLRIAGEPFYPADHAYQQTLERLVDALDLGAQVEFLGGVPAGEMPVFYRSLDVFVNWRARPALDKTGLEALAAGAALVTNNSAYAPLLGQFERDFMSDDTPAGLARTLADVLGLHPGLRAASVEKIRQTVVRNHSADGLAARLVGLFEALRTGVPPPFETVAGEKRA